MKRRSRGGNRRLFLLIRQPNSVRRGELVDGGLDLHAQRLLEVASFEGRNDCLPLRLVLVRREVLLRPPDKRLHQRLTRSSLILAM